jgi:formamidopyrimidine-DNA glycosylase
MGEKAGKMPELPEVETIRLHLCRQAKGKTIKEVIIKDKRLIKGISPQVFKAEVEGKTITDILRKGKVLIICLSSGKYIIFHLRISGWIILSSNEEKFCRVVFKLSNSKALSFCDSRVLGEIKLSEDWQKFPLIKRMGPDPFDLKKKSFIELFNGRKTKVKPLLMDQNFLAGVGNIYAQEALFCAGIHPERRADKLTSQEIGKIYDCLTSILKDAISKKGSSVDTYRAPDGSQDNYQSQLKVYGREGNPCPRCNKPIKKKSIGGRGTCFCPYCQT